MNDRSQKHPNALKRVVYATRRPSDDIQTVLDYLAGHAEELPRTVPLFIVRAGQDEMPDLNRSLDRFVGAALAHNLPLTVVNHPDAPHAFEMTHDSDRSRAISQQMLVFLQYS